MNTDDIRTLRQIDVDVENLEAQIETLKERRKKVHERVVGSFEREGVQHVRVDGRTFYLRRDVFARPRKGLGDQVAAFLRSDPATADLVKATVNSSTLASYVREAIAAHDDDLVLATKDARRRAEAVLDPRLMALLEVDETYSIRSQKVPTGTRAPKS